MSKIKVSRAGHFGLQLMVMVIGGVLGGSLAGNAGLVFSFCVGFCSKPITNLFAVAT